MDELPVLAEVVKEVTFDKILRIAPLWAIFTMQAVFWYWLGRRSRQEHIDDLRLGKGNN